MPWPRKNLSIVICQYGSIMLAQIRRARKSAATAASTAVSIFLFMAYSPKPTGSSTPSTHEHTVLV